MFDHSFQGVTLKICYNKKRIHHKSDTIITLLISATASGIIHYFHKLHFNYVREFWSGTLNKCQFVVYFKAVTFFYE